MAKPLRLLALSFALILTTALPWLASMLLTDIFAGLSVLSLFMLVLHGDKISAVEKVAAVRLYGLRRGNPQRDAWRCCLGLCCAGWIARPLLRERIAISGSGAGQPDHCQPAPPCCCRPISHCPDSWRGRPAATAIAFGRMLQDGIVDALSAGSLSGAAAASSAPIATNFRPPQMTSCGATACSTSLAVFQGMNDEMGFIAVASLAEYPLWQAEAASSPRHSNWLMWQPAKAPTARFPTPTASSSAICRRRSRRCARRINSIGTSILTAINRIHVPVALVSMLLVFAMFAPRSGGAGSTISRCSPRPCHWPCSATPLSAA